MPDVTADRVREEGTEEGEPAGTVGICPCSREAVCLRCWHLCKQCSPTLRVHDQRLPLALRFAPRQGTRSLRVWSMGRRRGEDSIASKKRRMPYVAEIKRDDPFCPEDEREIEAMCRRIAAAGEFMVLARWREDAGFRVFHFPTLAKARA